MGSYNSHTMAQCLRLVEPWLLDNKERVFVADSWFMGVRTAEAAWIMSSLWEALRGWGRQNEFVRLCGEQL